MTSFVLVHGGFHGGWCFKRVTRLLRAAGHDVYAPTLTGLGERSHLAHFPINLETHITDVANVILWEELDDVVLLGHSYGGMLITGVADRMPERIRSLVFLDAVLPEDGDSLLDLRAELQPIFLKQVAESDGQLIAPRPAAGFGVNEADQAWVDSKTTAHPFASFAQGLRLTGRHAEVGSRIYIYAADGPFGSPGAALCEPLRGQSGVQVFAISPSGHDIMIDQPEKLAELLMKVAGKAGVVGNA